MAVRLPSRAGVLKSRMDAFIHNATALIIVYTRPVALENLSTVRRSTDLVSKGFSPRLSGPSTQSTSGLAHTPGVSLR